MPATATPKQGTGGSAPTGFVTSVTVTLAHTNSTVGETQIPKSMLYRENVQLPSGGSTGVISSPI